MPKSKTKSHPGGKSRLLTITETGKAKLGPCAEPGCGKNWYTQALGYRGGRYPVRCPQHQTQTKRRKAGVNPGRRRALRGKAA